MKNITIHEIAEMAGVCIGTVSRVINNKDKVHPQTREKILKLIEQTGYRPSALGQGLRSRCSRCLLLQVPNIADPYSASVAKTISFHCRAAGYKMFLGDSDYDPQTEASYLHRLRDGGVDGLIISPLAGGKNNRLIAALVRDGFPVVAMDNPLPGVQVNSVRYDDYAGASAPWIIFSKKDTAASSSCSSKSNFKRSATGIGRIAKVSPSAACRSTPKTSSPHRPP